jgi:uncharacterized protein (TIGR03086 family)
VSDTADLLTLHGRALASTARFVDATTPDQLHLSTPCDGWDVRALLDHVVGGNLSDADAALGRPADRDRRDSDQVGDDHRAAYAASARTVTSALSAPDVFDRTFALTFGAVPGSIAVAIHFVDVVVHGWDLAVATGQDPAVDPSLCEAALGIAASYPEDAWGDDRFFASKVPVDDDAPAHDRLAAFLGRDIRR